MFFVNEEERNTASNPVKFLFRDEKCLGMPCWNPCTLRCHDVKMIQNWFFSTVHAYKRIRICSGFAFDACRKDGFSEETLKARILDGWRTSII